MLGSRKDPKIHLRMVALAKKRAFTLSAPRFVPQVPGGVLAGENPPKPCNREEFDTETTHKGVDSAKPGDW